MNIKCGACGNDYSGETWDAYYNHQCTAAEGARPVDPEYLIKTTTPNYYEIAASAKSRGQGESQPQN